jgi:cytochrome c553
MRQFLPLLVVTTLCAATSCTHPDGSAASLPAEELYRSCVPCHGAAGEGNPSIAAPAIAAHPKWYVAAQLTKFRSGIRGAHPDDYEGLRMRPMSRQLMTLDEVRVVSEYVSQLPLQKAAPSVTGDAVAGAATWNTCLACHGADGKGNQAVNAPPLAGQNDWYLLTQLKKFKAGIRGTNAYDTSGATMRPMSLTLVDEQAMKNVVAHINTLTR